MEGGRDAGIGGVYAGGGALRRIADGGLARRLGITPFMPPGCNASVDEVSNRFEDSLGKVCEERSSFSFRCAGAYRLQLVASLASSLIGSAPPSLSRALRPRAYLKHSEGKWPPHP